MFRMIRAAAKRLSCCPNSGVTYEVSVNFIDPSIREKYTDWLTNHHVDEVLRFPGFNSAEVFSVHQSGDVLVRYALDSLNVFNEYDASDVAKKLRDDARGIFGDKFRATRRVVVSQSIHFK